MGVNASLLDEIAEREAADKRREVLDRGRNRMLRMTLRTRILLVLFFIATASTTVTILLQDNALSADLRTAART